MDLDDDIFAKRKGGIFAKRSIASTEADVLKACQHDRSGKF